MHMATAAFSIVTVCYPLDIFIDLVNDAAYRYFQNEIDVFIPQEAESGQSVRIRSGSGTLQEIMVP